MNKYTFTFLKIGKKLCFSSEYYCLNVYSQVKLKFAINEIMKIFEYIITIFQKLLINCFIHDI